MVKDTTRLENGIHVHVLGVQGTRGELIEMDLALVLKAISTMLQLLEYALGARGDQETKQA